MVPTKMCGAVVLLSVVMGWLNVSPGCAAEPAQTTVRYSTETGPLRIGIVGLVHGHVGGLLRYATQHDDLKIVGVYDPIRAIFDRLAPRFKLDASLYYASLDEMLDATKPEAVSVMTSIKEHRTVVDACARRGVHVLLEKPLAFTNEDARHIEQVSRQHGIFALTNFETSWYPSVRETKRLVESGEMDPIRKMIFRHGHKGPVEVGCPEEFLAWLTDPEENGGGALVDFGCYGAILSTWLMNGERPTGVTATATTLKPATYPRVDDDATIVITYPTATAVLEASWAWTHDNKEVDVYTEKGSIHAGKWEELRVRDVDGPLKVCKPPAKPPYLDDEWTYLRQVVRGECAVDPLSSMELNLIAVDILDQARHAVARARTTSIVPAGAEESTPTKSASAPRASSSH